MMSMTHGEHACCLSRVLVDAHPPRAPAPLSLAVHIVCLQNNTHPRRTPNLRCQSAIILIRVATACHAQTLSSQARESEGRNSEGEKFSLAAFLIPLIPPFHLTSSIHM